MTDKKLKAIDITARIIFWITTATALCLIVHFTVYFLFTIAPQENTTRVNNTVKAVCKWAQEVESDAAFQACGVAQRESMTEYVCDNTNTYCQIEDKR
jgi:hypothetical protein